MSLIVGTAAEPTVVQRSLVLVGGGEFACIAYEYFTHDSHYQVVAVAVDHQFINDAEVAFAGGPPIIDLAFLEDHYLPGAIDVFVAIPATRMNRDRQAVFEKIEMRGYSFASYISSHAFVWHNVEIGRNTFIFESNTLQPFTKIGDNTILWSGNHVGHRTEIGNHVFITSHVVISGYCAVGDHSFMGVNSTINDGIVIAPFSLVGAGSHINRNTQERGIYVGSPAKRVEGRSSLDVDL